ncbi:MAG: hypothetical protein L7F77_06135 [Candidatus Magnetominusculus sp. LBB02]|nr:hypothetical protein [Candidatus Magnetominusculus sp. LBB02]
MVKILSYYLPLEKMQYLSVREAETEIIGLLMSMPKEITDSSMSAISYEDLKSKMEFEEYRD